MKSEINCNKCGSTQIVLQKRGFSVSIALISFLIISAILIYLWMELFKSQEFENKESYDLALKYHLGYTPVDWVNNKALWLGTAFLLAISLFTGIIGANKNKIVCMNCINQQNNSKKSFKNLATIALILISINTFSKGHHSRSGSHSRSHGGRFIGGHGSSHLGGHYHSRTGNGDHYSRRKR
ncbi:hypothetical protein HDF24_15215 [Mucilaginibacter sp. X4EP1]|uniref:hypothetical protein n=1 Tax=Mucilaginibacter sp. X4EP1 TaxID=2723092 RepID=UPI0021690642|nr:hypothetical protein [Mucilaginibacter sp. X4EP1]MCS3815352.1 Mn2+/Fe2+ NRAMP family transporter [Mucilaginibacter sp. X4EP1]